MVIVAIGYYTIWFTPLIFIGSLIGVIKAIKEERETMSYTVTCAISFWLIVVPIFMAIVYSS